MADRKKFEEMLELLVNENREAAQELFHELVVEKSREIYESILEDEEVDESDEDDLDESDDEDEDDELDEDFNLDEFEVEADDDMDMDMDMMGGDETDDMMGDLEMDDDDDMGMDDDEGEDDIEDRLDDIEDVIEELKAEFEEKFGDMETDDDMDDMGDDDMDMDDEGDDDMDDMGDDDMDMDDEGDDDMDMDDMDDEDEDDTKESTQTRKSSAEEMREYVEKIGGDRYDSFGKMGDNGANTKSAVAGKNDMGGTSQNILRTDTEQGVEANKGKLKGSALSDQSAKDMKTGNVNVPGGKAGGKHMKAQNGGGLDKNSVLKKDHSDKSASSTLNKVSTRAK